MVALTAFKQNPLVKMEVAPVTGSTVPVTNHFNWLVFTSTSTTAALTVGLPAGPSDGQQLMISNLGAITSFSLSPAVLGWTNTTALPAGQGLIVAYSPNLASGAGSWFIANF